EPNRLSTRKMLETLDWKLVAKGRFLIYSPSPGCPVPKDRPCLVPMGNSIQEGREEWHSFVIPAKAGIQVNSK
ncbi:MAG: hypothetical protein PVJ69_02315, partial [Desulfobacteraceae bacterium]